jgi:hypothetical protein
LVEKIKDSAKRGYLLKFEKLEEEMLSRHLM